MGYQMIEIANSDLRPDALLDFDFDGLDLDQWDGIYERLWTNRRI